MTVPRRLGPAIRWLAGSGRVAVAVALLAVLWVGTVKGVERASRDADERREADHSAVARGFASALEGWLDAGRREAGSLSRSAVGGDAQQAVDTLLRTPQVFTRDALVYSGSTVSAATARYTVLVGLRPEPCTRADEEGVEATDTQLEALVAAASSRATPIVSSILDVPGPCGPAVAVASAAQGVVAVVLGDIADLTARAEAGSSIGSNRADASAPAGRTSGGTRIFVVSGDLAVEPRLGVITTPSRIERFVASAERDGRQRERYTVGSDGAASVVAAYAPISDGWSVVLEQDAAIFDIERQNRPSVIVATVLTIVFAVVFALLAVFDLRRRRAHRRAEVAKNAFFSIAGHELRTPLTSLKGFAEMLSSRWSDLDDDRRRMLAERMAPQARRLDRLIERLLVAASIQAETHIRPEVRPLAVRPLFEGVAARFQGEAPLHTFVVDDRSRRAVMADAAALEQVLEHLLDNAVKYSPSGGVVTLGAEDRGRHVVITVEDEGVGLPSDFRHIFDKFVQGESVTKRVHDEGGVGLGLFIVQTLVEDMRGSVRAERRDPSGTRFVVTLRAVHGAPRPPAELLTTAAD
jgi:signal transduction histidine kinase